MSTRPHVGGGYYSNIRLDSCKMGFSRCKNTSSHVRSLLIMRSRADSPPHVHPSLQRWQDL